MTKDLHSASHVLNDHLIDLTPVFSLLDERIEAQVDAKIYPPYSIQQISVRTKVGAQTFLAVRLMLLSPRGPS